MEHGELMQSATARWTSEADGAAIASTRSFARLHDAVRFVMELGPDIRGTARIETAAGPLKISQIQAIFPSIREIHRFARSPELDTEARRGRQPLAALPGTDGGQV
jgi:hypothetical protein